MRLEPETPRTRSRISLTPLIDVVFILLLFFLVASHFDRWSALTLKAPGQASGESSDVETPAMLLRVHADGRMDLNGAPLDPTRLRDTLEHYRSRHPDLSVVLESDPEVELQALVTVMDSLNASGVRELNLR